MVAYLTSEVETLTRTFGTLQTHDVGHGRVEEVHQRSRDNRNVDVLPGERKKQGGDALGNEKQPVEICTQAEPKPIETLKKSMNYTDEKTENKLGS
jgi:hypothetical protein